MQKSSIGKRAKEPKMLLYAFVHLSCSLIADELNGLQVCSEPSEQKDTESLVQVAQSSE